MSDRINPTAGLSQGEGGAAAQLSLPRDKDEFAPFDAACDESAVMEYVKVLYKRRWAAATVFLVVLISAVVYSFTATPVFEARTRLIIENDAPNVVAFKAVVEEGQASVDYYQTQYGILQSRGLARRTIDDLRMWKSQNFGGKREDASFRLTSPVAWLSTLLRRAPDRSSTPVVPVVDAALAQSAVIDSFLSNLTVEPLRNSRLVDVKFRSTDAALTARVANQLAKNYIEHSLEYRFTASQEASSWLADRLAEQRAQVETAEARLQRYREQNGAIRLEDRENIVVQKLGELNTAVTRAKMERLQKEAVDHQLSAIEHDEAALETFPVVLSNAFIQRQKTELSELQQQQAQLSDRLGPSHPDMLKLQSAIQNAQLKLRAETANVVQAVHTDYQAAVTQEQSLVGALEQQKNEALAMNRKAIEYSVLAREVDSSKQIYDSLLQRSKETGVAGELKSSNIRVVDEAEQPRSPVSPQRRQNTMLGAFGGLILGIGFAFFFEFVDSRIKSPEEIKASLGLPSLGMLPALGKRWMNAAPLLNIGLPPNFSEMLRTIRTNIIFSSSEEDRARSRSRAPVLVKERRWSPAIWRSASRSPDNACCSSTPTCAAHACTNCSSWTRNLGCRTSSSAMRNRAPPSARRMSQGCGYCRRGGPRPIRPSCSARSASRSSWPPSKRASTPSSSTRRPSWSLRIRWSSRASPRASSSSSAPR